MTVEISLDQVEGCLLGGLVGDCLGFPFENECSHNYSLPKVQDFIDNLLKTGAEKLKRYYNARKSSLMYFKF